MKEDNFINNLPPKPKGLQYAIIDDQDWDEFNVVRTIMGLSTEEMFRRVWEDYKKNSIYAKTGMPNNSADRRGVFLPK